MFNFGKKRSGGGRKGSNNVIFIQEEEVSADGSTHIRRDKSIYSFEGNKNSAINIGGTMENVTVGGKTYSSSSSKTSSNNISTTNNQTSTGKSKEGKSMDKFHDGKGLLIRAYIVRCCRPNCANYQLFEPANPENMTSREVGERWAREAGWSHTKHGWACKGCVQSSQSSKPSKK